MSSVSVALATYNGERFLERQLDSLAEQTLVPSELVVTDDGSSDATLRIVSDFAARSPFPVRIHRNPQRLGYGGNFCSAVQACTGTYVAFCDQDDVWHPQKLERCIAALQSSQAVLCAHTAALIDADGNRIGDFSQGIAETRVWPARHLPPWEVFFGFTLVFERQLFDLIDPALRGLDSHERTSLLAHDRWIYVLGTSLGRTVTLTDPLADYRQHGANLYGGQRKGLLRRLRGKLVGSADLLNMYSAIASHRADLFRNLAGTAPSEQIASEAKAAASHWNDIGEVYRLRAEMYLDSTLRCRAKRLGDLVGRHVYARQESGGLGHKVLLKDIGLGVLGLRFESPSSSASGHE